MASTFKNYSAEVKAALKECKKSICNEWGTTLVAEYKSRTPVITSNMKRSETFDVLPNNDGIYVGVTPEADYAEWVENGSSRQPAQHILEGTIQDNNGVVQNIVERIISKIGN